MSHGNSEEGSVEQKEEVVPDLTIFPLLSPDLIPHLSDAWLQRAQMQIGPLIKSFETAVRGRSEPRVSRLPLGECQL